MHCVCRSRRQLGTQDCGVLLQLVRLRGGRPGRFEPDAVPPQRADNSRSLLGAC